MTTLLFGIIISALLSVTSLLTVFFRVSPLSAPSQALPAFFLSLFLTLASLGALAFAGLWRMVTWHTWDAGKVLSVSLREGIFFALATTILLMFHLIGLLNWWIGILIYVVFILIELALQS